MFANIDWARLCQKSYKAPFKPRDVMQMKFFKEHNRWATQADTEYVYDTRFFSPKQTKKEIEPIQKVVDQLLATGKSIPVAVPKRPSSNDKHRKRLRGTKVQYSLSSSTTSLSSLRQAFSTLTTSVQSDSREK